VAVYRQALDLTGDEAEGAFLTERLTDQETSPAQGTGIRLPPCAAARGRMTAAPKRRFGQSEKAPPTYF